MSKYVDAEWLKAEFPHDEDWNYPVNTNSYVVGMIDEAPSIDIVFCKDCKLGGTEDCPMDEIDDEYFCNFGEREGE